MTLPQPPPDLTRTIQRLAEINRFTLKAIQSPSLEALIFLILNDTTAIVRYDRAILWELKHGGKNPKLLGVSGQPKVSKQTDLSRTIASKIKSIKEIETAQILEFPDQPKTSILWLPITIREEKAMSLWLEKWNGATWKQEEIDILNYLAQVYGAAFEKYYHKFRWNKFSKRPLKVALSILTLALLMARVPLRIVAPCEVVPQNPIVITAPLEGIIEKIDITPGQYVKKGDLLFEYDKRVPLEELRVAQKKVAIIQSEVERSTALGLKDKKALAELGVNMLKLKKEQLELELAEYHATQLEVESPMDGVAMIDNPEEWHGKPVKIGEKVLIVSNPNQTKVRINVPEEDNIPLDMDKPIKIFLNTSPEISRSAKLTYIASYTHVTEKQVTSFVAEAEWTEKYKDVKLGLKGTAVLYGEEVSLFYWIIRKPLAYVRHYTGI
jgi:multidrug resistance efflux pump